VAQPVGMTLAIALARMSIMSGGDRTDPARSDVKLTYDDYLLFPDDGKLHELIDGEHFVTPSPNLRHQAILGVLHGLIWSYLQEQPIGSVFMSRLDVVLSKYDVVEPDLLYVSRARAAEVLSAAHVRGAPDLVVEIGSPSTRKRDETIKRRLCERFGVTEYWVVDPEVDVVRVYRRSDDRFERAVELSREDHDVLTTPLLAGLELPLERIFRE
jgi:Uma2 family endonuclease